MKDEERRELLRKAASGDADAAIRFAELAADEERRSSGECWIVLVVPLDETFSLARRHIVSDKALCTLTYDEESALRGAHWFILGLLEHEVEKAMSTRYDAAKSRLDVLQKMSPREAYAWWEKRGQDLGYLGAVRIMRVSGLRQPDAMDPLASAMVEAAMAEALAWRKRYEDATPEIGLG